MIEHGEVLSKAHEVLDDLRSNGAKLDGTDASLWFVQGVLESMSTKPNPDAYALDLLAYAVYIAEVLAATCAEVRVEVEANGTAVRDVLAVRSGGARQFVLSWVQGCVEDPEGDNIVFKYAGALRDFGERERAKVLSEQLRQYAAHRRG